MGEIPWLVLISNLHGWVQYLGCGQDRPLESRNGPSAIGPQLFGSRDLLLYDIDNSRAAAKYELYILLPAEQRCSKKCVAALQADIFVYLSLPIYIYMNCDISCISSILIQVNRTYKDGPNGHIHIFCNSFLGGWEGEAVNLLHW